jgi:hypothetical protein
MLDEALCYARDRISAKLAAMLGENGARRGIQGFVSWWRRRLEQSGFEIGCPVMAVAVEPPEPGENANEELRALAAEAFRQWQVMLADALVSEGASPRRARTASVLIVSALEGAIAQCRAALDTKALDHIECELGHLLTGILPDGVCEKAPVERRSVKGPARP